MVTEVEGRSGEQLILKLFPVSSGVNSSSLRTEGIRSLERWCCYTNSRTLTCELKVTCLEALLLFYFEEVLKAEVGYVDKPVYLDFAGVFDILDFIFVAVCGLAPINFKFFSDEERFTGVPIAELLTLAVALGFSLSM